MHFASHCMRRRSSPGANMKFSWGRASLIFVFLPFVNAHGCISFISLDGVVNYGYKSLISPCGNSSVASTSAIRGVSTEWPIQTTDNSSLGCGISAIPAPNVLNAKPGSLFQFNWRRSNGWTVGHTSILPSHLF
jgi:hypothetical protein